MTIADIQKSITGDDTKTGENIHDTYRKREGIIR